MTEGKILKNQTVLWPQMPHKSMLSDVDVKYKRQEEIAFQRKGQRSTQKSKVQLEGYKKVLHTLGPTVL